MGFVFCVLSTSKQLSPDYASGTSRSAITLVGVRVSRRRYRYPPGWDGLERERKVVEGVVEKELKTMGETLATRAKTQQFVGSGDMRFRDDPCPLLPPVKFVYLF